MKYKKYILTQRWTKSILEEFVDSEQFLRKSLKQNQPKIR